MVNPKQYRFEARANREKLSPVCFFCPPKMKTKPDIDGKAERIEFVDYH